MLPLSLNEKFRDGRLLFDALSVFASRLPAATIDTTAVNRLSPSPAGRGFSAGGGVLRFLPVGSVYSTTRVITSLYTGQRQI